MKNHILLIFFATAAMAVTGCTNDHGHAGRTQGLTAGGSKADIAKMMEQSIVYLKTSLYGYEQRQPWKNKDLSESWAYGCAVGKNEVITTAWTVANMAFIKARRHGQNEFINTKIKVIDYESNLCLIELDPNAMGAPLEPLKFSENYQKGAGLDFYWLSEDGFLYSGRGFLDRIEVEKSSTLFDRRLDYVAANISTATTVGQLYCASGNPIGIACWSNGKEAGIIPAETINKFLAQAAAKNYKGFGSAGFTTSDLLDPVMRSFLKMPTSINTGVYVSDVYTLGTGSDVLRKADVILSIDGHGLSPYGLFEHPQYGQIHFSYLITGKAAGDKVLFELWRDGEKKQIQTEVKNFKASEMLVPYHEFDRQPEYIVTGGFILQKLTREYLAQWGEDWPGKVSPHLYHYYHDLAFMPTPERSDIVILSYVMPTEFNLGYHDLRQMVVKTFNGMTIRSIRDILTAQKLNPQSKYDVIEFELNSPTVVIDRGELSDADMLISKRYGIPKLVNVNQ